ncbi:12055_t:CDS:2 [Entrophospora sp. SA101]|nr:12055_t:CDS:2 [Entrophospora sp. SA101]CAJ0844028.1 13296_t:CDS:2 [Entrophospora sp. SA101]
MNVKLTHTYLINDSINRSNNVDSHHKNHHGNCKKRTKHSSRGSLNHHHSKDSFDGYTKNIKLSKDYPNVGELLWDQGRIYSDVKLTFEDNGVLAKKAGIPIELRLHSIVLFQSQFFKDQLSKNSSLSTLISREKQIIVKLPSRVTEEDMVNFYCTLKLMYTKRWDHELSDNLSKGVGCLSVCFEIGYSEGIEICWKWIIRKCNHDKNKEMVKRLIEAYPDLNQQFNNNTNNINHLTMPSSTSLTKTVSSSSASTNNSSSSLTKRNSSILQRRTSRRSKRSSTSRRNNNFGGSKSNKTIASIASAITNISPNNVVSDTLTSNYQFPSLPPSPPPTIYANSKLLKFWISKFESYATSAKRSCQKLSKEFRDDSRCFPFLESFYYMFNSIVQLGQSRKISSPEALDFTLRMLNVIRIEHNHFHTLHVNNNNNSNSGTSTIKLPPIVLHRSLDEPLSELISTVLEPLEQKYLCSNISQVHHMIVGGKMESLMKNILEKHNNNNNDDVFDGFDDVQMNY